MPNSTQPIDRKTFLRHAGGMLGLVALDPSLPLRLSTPNRALTHPDPRPGITSERVLTADALGTSRKEKVVTAYDAARAYPELFDGLGCTCGCTGNGPCIVRCSYATKQCNRRAASGARKRRSSSESWQRKANSSPRFAKPSISRTADVFAAPCYSAARACVGRQRKAALAPAAQPFRTSRRPDAERIDRACDSRAPSRVLRIPRGPLNINGRSSIASRTSACWSASAESAPIKLVRCSARTPFSPR